MSNVVKVGEKLPLVAHLECPDASVLYVEAVIKRPDRSQLLGSPIDLGNEGSGIYFDDSISMPDESFVTVTYNIYDDAAKTIPSEDYCSVTETVNRSDGGSGQNIVTNTPDRIVGRVKDERLTAKINDNGPAKALVSDPQAGGQLLDDQSDQIISDDTLKIRST